MEKKNRKWEWNSYGLTTYTNLAVASIYIYLAICDLTDTESNFPLYVFQTSKQKTVQETNLFYRVTKNKVNHSIIVSNQILQPLHVCFVLFVNTVGPAVNNAPVNNIGSGNMGVLSPTLAADLEGLAISNKSTGMVVSCEIIKKKNVTIVMKLTVVKLMEIISYISITIKAKFILTVKFIRKELGVPQT